MITIKRKRVEDTTVKHDSIEYKVYVYEEKGGYWGEWYCTTCRKWGSGGSKKCISIEEAIEASELHSGMHHSQFHEI